MTGSDMEIILERCKELHPEARPRIVADNGPQFIRQNFAYYPQWNGKIERWHKSLT